MKFDDSLAVKVDMRRVKLDVMKPWISKRLAEILGIEDDVVVEFVFNQLEDDKDPDPRKMQINLTGFLNGKNARVFMGELWAMLDSAQKNESGIPQQLLDEKKEELKSRRGDHERVQDNLRRLAEESGGDRGGRHRSRDREHFGRRSRSRDRDHGSRRRRSRSRERRRSRSRSRDRGSDRSRRRFTEDEAPSTSSQVTGSEGDAAVKTEPEDKDAADAVKTEDEVKTEVKTEEEAMLPDSTEELNVNNESEEAEQAEGEDAVKKEDAAPKEEGASDKADPKDAKAEDKPSRR